MIKKIALIILFIFLLSVLISAQDTLTNKSTTDPLLNKTKISTEKTDNILEREVEMSEPIKKIVGISLGFNKGEKITWTIMVGIITFMIFIFLLLNWAFELIPFFQGIGKILGAILITLLLGVTKGIKETIDFYFKATDSVKIIEQSSTGALIVLTILIIGLLTIGKKIIKSLKKIEEIEKAEIDGTKIGWNIATLNKLKEELFRKGD
ncbi:MAG: hypothetical protein ACP5NS_03885 [Candidatus Pacearchaeota archaeon]